MHLKTKLLTTILFPLSCLAHAAPGITPFSSTIEQFTQKSVIQSDWTFIVYMAADNDLDYFARRNLEQLKAVGSNENISIVVQLDRHGAHEHTKRLYVTKGQLYQMNAHDITAQQKLNSGSAQTLIDCCEWAIKNFPAKHYALVLWNHGIGILDSIRSKTTNASELFTFNPSNHMLELDRSVGFFDFLERKSHEEERRGVCFSDTYGSYLTNQKIDFALKTICEKYLYKKFDIIAFDACLMSMVEVASLIRPYANIMVASEEVELGTGWPYDAILAPFEKQTLSPEEFGLQIVNAYAKHYHSITKDFTQAATNLSSIELVEKNVNQVSTLLLEALQFQKSYSVKRAIQASRSKRTCTYFSEPSYIDLHHFYSNLLESLEFVSLEEQGLQLLPLLKQRLHEGLTLIELSLIANATGENLTRAKGLSIYFPLRSIDPSYNQTSFANATRWVELIKAVM